DEAGGPVPADGGRHVLLRAWRRRLPETRPGWAHHGDRFHPRAHGDLVGGGIRGPRQFLPDVGTREARRLRRGGEGETFKTSAGDEAWGATGMMAGNSGGDSAVGGPARHIPVLLAEVLSALQPAEGQTIIDGTFGAGGYTKAQIGRA